MHLKSEKKIIEQIDLLSEKEVFRAYLQALKQSDMKFAISILEHLPDEKRLKVERCYSIYFAKLFALDAYLLSKAFISIGYYNTLISKLLKLTSFDDSDSNNFTIERVKEQEEWLDKLRKLDKETDGMLELEEFDEIKKVIPFVDYWMETVSAISPMERA
jgi:hypothetical protein